MTRLRLALLLAASLASSAAAQTARDETVITALVLRSWMNIAYGGDAVAEPEHRRKVLLHRWTIAPSAEQLQVRVFSPQNQEPSALYRQLRAAGVVADLRRRSRTSTRVRTVPEGFKLGTVVRDPCGPWNDRTWLNTAAVSRPGFTKQHDRAIVYVETVDEAVAYLLERTGGGWRVTDYVQLWGCG